jgi:ribosomal protein L44E
MSKQHYTRNTMQATEYCKKCQKYTLHNVADCRKGSCTECMARLEIEYEKRKLEPKPAEQTDLFAAQQPTHRRDIG